MDIQFNPATSYNVTNSSINGLGHVSGKGYSTASKMYAAAPAPASKPWYSIFTNCFSKVSSFFSGIFAAVKTYFCGPGVQPLPGEKDKIVKFLDMVKNNAAGTADEKQAFGTFFATINPTFQNWIKELIWIGGGRPNFNGDFAEDKLKNDPKHANVVGAVDKFVTNFDRYDALAKFEAVVNDGTKTPADVTNALLQLAPFNNMNEAIKYKLYQAHGGNSNVADWSGQFITNNGHHSQELKDAVRGVRLDI